MSAWHTEWEFKGEFLNVSKLTQIGAGANVPASEAVWTFQGDSLSCQKTEVWTAGDSMPPPSSSAPGGAASVPAQDPAQKLQNAEEYLNKHQVQAKVEAAVNELLKTMPENAIDAIADKLKSLAVADLTPAEAPAAVPAVNQAELEKQIKEQGDKVRAMKEANKDAPNTHSKEEIDGAVARLKELKDKLPKGGGPDDKKEKKDKKDKKGGQAAVGGHMIPTEPVSGTRDFYPEEMRARNYLFQHFKDVARLYAFQEYDAPVLEHEELYKRKAGEEITQQMYNFIDKSGYAVTLRPEMTPTLARMILGRTTESGETKMILPVKWFSLPQCWRFETTQRGRKREHYQWNMDIVGVKSIAAEVELLSAITCFFLNVGITSKDVGIKVNSRKVMASILKSQGISDEQFAPVCVVVDKLDKIGDDAVTAELVGLGVQESTARTIIKTMSARSVEELSAIAKGADEEGLNELKDLFEQAKAYGFEDFLLFDASVVRGLAYYTGIVFECFDRTGELRAICGGGRYDRLLSLYGSKQEVPCVGERREKRRA